ncbi:SDR family oxidoreductase [Massilia sp. erpn]|uniref:SDR family oxidoreductase n=1 Tax=Massilia sp. erpn TaxID=2738142 RepID=UPI002103E60D|nr:SDR family oxidoreductase [Massilia sp. erpn]UTY57035.1 SDR family oxidoreductase [Massilia sp. erpn]
MSRVVLITGACGGIGRVLCERFAAQGDHVLALDRDAQQLAELAASIANCTPLQADITDAAATKAAVHAAVARHGAVDVLVANAGAAACSTLAATTPESWHADINLNLHGTYNTVEAVRPAMLERGQGCIVLIGSVNGLTALGHPAYSAAKAALVSYTKALALESGRRGVRANIVCPGTVKTQAWQARVDKDPQILEKLKKWYPLGDFATPDDIADAALFLSSSAARVITGVVLPVDGGLMAGNRVMAQELTLEDF